MQNFSLQVRSSYQHLYNSTSVKYLDAALQMKLSCWCTARHTGVLPIYCMEKLWASQKLASAIPCILPPMECTLYAHLLSILIFLFLIFSVPRYFNHRKKQGVLFIQTFCLFKKALQRYYLGHLLEKLISFFKTTP